MQWWLLILTVLAWFGGVEVLRNGFRITKENIEDKKKSTLDPIDLVGVSFTKADIILDFLFGLISFTFVKYSPWWVLKTCTILVGFGLFFIGILPLMKLGLW